MLLLPGETLPLAVNSVSDRKSFKKSAPESRAKFEMAKRETKNVMKKVRFSKKLSKKLVGMDPVAHGVPTCQIDQLK